MSRDLAIDVLKFLAIIFVVNSHLDVCYPVNFRFLATGGALGDALFFFCSGFTLFIGRDDGFCAWYGRRLKRILPSTLLCLAAYLLFYGDGWWVAIGGYWFVRCILIYYVFLFLIRKYLRNNLGIAFAIVTVIVCVWFGFEDSHRSIYGGGYFMWSHYFIPMLSGACIGLHRDAMHCHWYDGLVSIMCVALYFVAWKCGMRQDVSGWLQLVSIPFLTLSIVFLYRALKSSIIQGIMCGKIGCFMTVIGGLCLEVYLSHRVFLSSKFNSFFPLNVVVIFCLVLLLAYLVRSIKRIVMREGNVWQL